MFITICRSEGSMASIQKSSEGVTNNIFSLWLLTMGSSGSFSFSSGYFSNDSPSVVRMVFILVSCDSRSYDKLEVNKSIEIVLSKKVVI